MARRFSEIFAWWEHRKLTNWLILYTFGHFLQFFPLYNFSSKTRARCWHYRLVSNRILRQIDLRLRIEYIFLLMINSCFNCFFLQTFLPNFLLYPLSFLIEFGSECTLLILLLHYKSILHRGHFNVTSFIIGKLVTQVEQFLHNLIQWPNAVKLILDFDQARIFACLWRIQLICG